MQTIAEQRPLLLSGARASTCEAWTARRELRLPPEEIVRLPKGEALVMIGPNWRIMAARPYQLHPTFAYLANEAQPSIDRLAQTIPTPGPHRESAPHGGAVTEPQSGEGKEAKRP